MFKVECLGCQAPYQVDEKRVPEKGLKMRCPKCGTTFRVEPPGGSAPADLPSAGQGEEPRADQPPSAPRFSSGAVEPNKFMPKPASARDSLSRTMIGVSSADLPMPARSAAGDKKPFRIPRPNAAGSDATASTPSAATAATAASPRDAVPTPPAAAPAAPAPAAPGRVQEAWIPAESDAPPESLAEPSSPLRLSELPQPLAGAAQAQPPMQLSKAPTGQDPNDLELDYGDDLPVAAVPGRKPPPRRPRPGAGADDKVEAAEPASPAETIDLPAKLADLQPSVAKVAPAPAPVAARPAASEPKASARPKSSLEELDLPDLPGREGVAGLPAAKPPRRALPEVPAKVVAAAARESAPKPPAAAAKPAPAPKAPAPAAPPKAPERSVLELDLPALGSQRPRRPNVSDLPDVLGVGLPDTGGVGLPDVPAAGLPDVATTGLPDVASTGLPDVLSAGLPAVSATGLPANVAAGLPGVVRPGLPAVAAGLPEVARAGLPQVVTPGLPEVSGTGLPDVLRAGLPAVSDTGLPEVMARGVGGFGRVNLPVAREAGLPEVRAPGIGPMDLPSVGDALPALVGDSWDSANLPASGGNNPFGDFGAPGGDEDPFAGSEAEFGSATAADDPFAHGVSSDGFDVDGAPPASSAYGELDIAGGVDSPPIETEDMEQAIPQRSSAPPRGNAAAHASVHESADADTAGSTLELGPERRTMPRRRSRRVLVALGVCAAAIAGGALALEPRVGPFGIHFILDQVHRPEHERQLTQLVVEGRNGSAKDTLDAATSALGKLEAARSLAPRFEPLHARSAFAHFDVALRFGPLPKLEAAGKAALERIAAESQSADARLARAAHAAVTRDKEARKLLAGLGNDPDARLLAGEVALREADWAEAVKIWGELAKGEPQSARVAFGLARAELGRGQPGAARSEAQRVLTLSPEHVGARIVLLDAQRALVSAGAKNTPAELGTETLVANLQQALPHASPGEAALAHSVLGEVHASQGRIAPAQHAFEEALAVNRNFPRALVGLGEALALGGRHVEALARFEAAVQERPDLLQAELGVAKSQIQLGRVPEAQTILKRLLEKYPAHPGVLYWRGRAEQAAGEHEAALATYRASIESSKGKSESVDAYLALARLQVEQGQLALAEQTLSEAQQKLPPSGALHKALGEIAMSRAEYQRAYDAFQQALLLDRGDTRARFLGATALTRLGRFEEALSAFASVSETDKDFPGLAVERGRLFEESGRNDEALQEYEAAFAKSPEDPEVQIRVGCARVVAGRATAAREVLEKALKSRQRSAEANHCMGRALFGEEQSLDALLRLERAVALDPTRAVYHLHVGWVAAELGRLRDASISLEKALELDKGLADAYWQRGRLRQKQGAVRDAIRDLQRALELKPARNEARADLAAALADLGRTREALQTWEQAIAGDSDNSTWHFRYAKLLSSAGSGEMAQAHLRRAIDLVEEARKAAPTEKPKPPVWLWQAHYLLARELGQVQAAVQHWQAFLKLSPPDDPYRPEAQRALVALGQPWEPR